MEDTSADALAMRGLSDVTDSLIKGDRSWLMVLKPLFPLIEEAVKAVVACTAYDDILPPFRMMLAWTEVPVNAIKVVIVGQDPYPNRGDGIGVAFATMAKRCPRSLKNIFSSLHFHGWLKGQNIPPNDKWRLDGWRNQGVLLINTSMTVEHDKPMSHKSIWDSFATALIRTISEQCSDRGIVFMLWGGQAQKKAKFIDSSHLILKCEHPVIPTFVGSCNHWNAANAFLKESGQAPIEWGAL